MARYKTGPQARTVRKAFDSAVAMRKSMIQRALKFIHTNPNLVVDTEELNLKHRMRSNNAYVLTMIEEIVELDMMICKLSEHL